MSQEKRWSTQRRNSLIEGLDNLVAQDELLGLPTDDKSPSELSEDSLDAGSAGGIEIDEARSTAPPKSQDSEDANSQRSSGLSDLGGTPSQSEGATHNLRRRGVRFASPLTQSGGAQSPPSDRRRSSRSTAGQPPPNLELDAPLPKSSKPKKRSKPSLVSVDMSEEEELPLKKAVKESGKTKPPRKAKTAAGPQTRARAKTHPRQVLSALPNEAINKRTSGGSSTKGKDRQRTVFESSAQGVTSRSSSRGKQRAKSKGDQSDTAEALPLITFVVNWFSTFDGTQCFFRDDIDDTVKGLASLNWDARRAASTYAEQQRSDKYLISREAELFISANSARPAAVVKPFDVGDTTWGRLDSLLRYYDNIKTRYLKVCVKESWSAQEGGLPQPLPTPTPASQPQSSQDAAPSFDRVPPEATYSLEDLRRARAQSQRNRQAEKDFKEQFWRDIKARWKCEDRFCPNTKWVACFTLDDDDTLTHYPIGKDLVYTWREDHRAGQSTIENPSRHVIGQIQKAYKRILKQRQKRGSKGRYATANNQGSASSPSQPQL